MMSNRKVIPFIFSIVLFIFPFWGLTYTSDWEAYNYFFDHPEDSRDLLFGILAEIFINWGLDFTDLYKFHIILIAISYLYLFKLLNVNPIVFTLIMISLFYVQIGNQIRYYVAFPLIIISFYKLINGKIIVALSIGLISFLFHKSTFLLFISWIIYFYLFKRYKFWNQIFLLLIANLLILILLKFSSAFDEKYDDYHSIYRTSSILGGIFNLVPCILPLLIIFYNQLKFKWNNFIKISPLFYKFLITTSITSSIFILSSLSMQVLAHRLIFSLFPIWITLLLYLKSHSKLKFKKSYKDQIIFLFIFIYFWKFIFVPLIGLNQNFLEISEMLNSYKF